MKVTKKYGDIEWLELLKSGPKGRNTALKFFYQNDKIRLGVKRVVFENGGNQQDAEDMLQEAIVAFDRNIREEKFRGESAAATYIISIARNKWIARFKKTMREETSDNVFSLVEENEKEPYSEMSNEIKQKLWTLVSELKPPCPKVLKMWVLGTPMEELQVAFDYQNIQSAKNRVHRCREFLRNVFVERNLVSEVLGI